MSSGQNGSNEGEFALDQVYKLLQREASSPTLQAIEPDTLQKIAAALGSLKGQGYEGIEAKVRDRMAELLAMSARLLIEARQRKILSGAPVDYAKLADEEKYVLDGKRELDGRLAEVMSATLKGRSKVLESIAARMRSKRLVVRFVKPMEQFIGVDMNKYGPFQQEDVASLPFENARSLIENKTVVEVHAQLAS
jgi:DNA replication factor GINS